MRHIFSLEPGMCRLWQQGALKTQQATLRGGNADGRARVNGAAVCWLALARKNKG